MKKLYIYVDNSNFFIEGQRVAAVKKGMAYDIWDAQNRNAYDFSWNVEYGKLLSYLTEMGNGGEVAAAKLWGSIPPSDSFWKLVEDKGFSVRTFQRGVDGREKKVDVAIATQITKDVYSGVIDKENGIIVLISGDKDFIPVIEDVVHEGYTVHIVFWNHAARELKEAATYFINLDPVLDRIKNGGPRES